MLDVGDAVGYSAVPAWADHEVEARIGSVLLADSRELIGARVIERIDPEAIAEIRDLEGDGRLVQREDACAIRDVMARAADGALFRVHVAGQHCEPPKRDR